MLDTDNIIAVLAQPSHSPAVRGHALHRLRQHAAVRLQAACERIGISTDDLADNDRAVAANLLFQKAATVERSERLAALLIRWCVEAEERGFDTLVTTRIVQALRDMENAIASEQQQAARKSSLATRQKQTQQDDAKVVDLFKNAYRNGMGRVRLQAAAMTLIAEKERRLRDKLITAQQVDNQRLQRQHSGELESLKRQTVLCTLHRADNWLKQHRESG